MSTNFPTTLDSYTTKNNGDVIDATHIDNPQDAIVALETKVGVDSSAVTSTLDYKLKNTASSDPGHKHTVASLSDFNVSAPAAGQSLVYSGGKWVNTAGFKFGGTGADGALAISSGTTTISLGNAALVEKNYTSISITATGKLAFSNPHANGTVIVLKSTGAVTLTSSQTPMIDASIMGASSTNFGNGNIFTTNQGVNGSNAGTAGAGGAALNVNTSFFYRDIIVTCGAAGGIGGTGTNSNAGGAGGTGGGGLVIECGGAFNFTTASGISVAAGNGTVGSNSQGGTSAAGGGGGGGAGGSFICIYQSLTAKTGTITVTAGTGAAAGSGGGSGTTGGGGGGGANVAAGTTGSTSTGGAGASGFSLMALNTELA